MKLYGVLYLITAEVCISYKSLDLAVSHAFIPQPEQTNKHLYYTLSLLLSILLLYISALVCLLACFFFSSVFWGGYCFLCLPIEAFGFQRVFLSWRNVRRDWFSVPIFSEFLSRTSTNRWVLQNPQVRFFNGTLFFSL